MYLFNYLRNKNIKNKNNIRSGDFVPRGTKRKGFKLWVLARTVQFILDVSIRRGKKKTKKKNDERYQRFCAIELAR